jgi:hypothetical protein
MLFQYITIDLEFIVFGMADALNYDRPEYLGAGFYLKNSNHSFNKEA